MKLASPTPRGHHIQSCVDSTGPTQTMPLSCWGPSPAPPQSWLCRLYTHTYTHTHIYIHTTMCPPVASSLALLVPAQPGGSTGSHTHGAEPVPDKTEFPARSPGFRLSQTWETCPPFRGTKKTGQVTLHSLFLGLGLYSPPSPLTARHPSPELYKDRLTWED